MRRTLLRLLARRKVVTLGLHRDDEDLDVSQTETVTSTLRHISKLQGIEREALQAGDDESLLVARMMRGEITRLRAKLLGASPPPIRDVGAVEIVTPGRLTRDLPRTKLAEGRGLRVPKCASVAPLGEELPVEPSDDADRSRAKITGDEVGTSAYSSLPHRVNKLFTEAQRSGAHITAEQLDLAPALSLTVLLERDRKCLSEASLDVTRVSQSRVVIDLVAGHAEPDVPHIDRVFLEVLADQLDRGQRAMVSKADFMDQVRSCSVADADKE